jgi:hypothetical protein
VRADGTLLADGLVPGSYAVTILRPGGGTLGTLPSVLAGTSDVVVPVR